MFFMSQRFTLSDLGMDAAFLDMPLYREFEQPNEFDCLLDESAIRRFRLRHKWSKND